MYNDKLVIIIIIVNEKHNNIFLFNTCTLYNIIIMIQVRFLRVKLDSCVINGQFLGIVDIEALY